MKIIVGLGNIGKEYADTRHNIGFMVLDALASRFGVANWQNKWQANVADVYNPRMILVKPTTYMNLSGNAVREVCNFYNCLPEDILVIHDDLDIPCGNIKIRKNGGAGGHNGIRSVIANLSTENFPRMRIGIAHPRTEGAKVVDYVLGRFAVQEQEIVQNAIKIAVDAIEEYVNDVDINNVMNKYNTKKPKKEKKVLSKTELDNTAMEINKKIDENEEK